VDRVAEEISLLKQNLGDRMKVHSGPKTVGGIRYTAVIIENVSLDRRKFGVARTKLLIMLPPNYPTTPPIGFYVDFPWKTEDHHFTEQSHYGAPDLRSANGYYWYCGGLGGGFSPHDWKQSWRPGRAATKGHNLITLFVSAQVALNT
jgi:hypothetical protein